jgi:osmoprotectant transport system permease protein
MPLRGAVAAALAASLLGAAARADAAPTVRVGSKRFTESYILAEIAIAAARRAGAPTWVHEQGLGGTALVFRALEEGSIDLYPEYTGTIAEAILHAPGRTDLASLRRALAPRGIAVGDPLGFDNTYGLAVSAKLSAARRLTTISDLTAAADLRFGLSPEFLGRSDGFGALAAAYGLPRTHVEALDHGLAYQALLAGSIDVTDVYSTDAKIKRYDLRVLQDDRRFFPSYQAVYLYRQDLPARAPAAMRSIAALSGTIDDATMVDLNARAELEGQTFRSIAEAFVAGPTGGGAPAEKRQSLLQGTWTVLRTEGPRHLSLVALSVLAAVALGVPLGILSVRARALGRVVMGATSVVQTIPALALLVFFIPLLGTGRWPALAALFLYALLPIVRNTVAGFDGIAPGLRESAIALGLSGWARLVRIELPLASPTILAGVRTSAVIAVGGATLAAFVGAGGFGAPISAGLNLDDTSLILQGAIPAAGLALAVEGLFAVLDRALIPRGLRPRSLGRGARVPHHEPDAGEAR